MKRPKFPTSIIGGVVALAFLVVAVILGLSFESHGDLSATDETLIATFMSLVLSSTIPAFLALLKSESTQNDLHNGTIKNKMKDAIKELNAESQPQTPPAVPSQVIEPLDDNYTNNSAGEGVEQ